MATAGRHHRVWVPTSHRPHPHLLEPGLACSPSLAHQPWCQLQRTSLRWIRAKGRYRDPVRSTDDQVVMTPGLQWVSLMLLTRIGWAGRHWALPFLTALVVSARYDRRKGRRHKTVTDSSRYVMQANLSASTFRLAWQSSLATLSFTAGPLPAVCLRKRLGSARGHEKWQHSYLTLPLYSIAWLRLVIDGQHRTRLHAEIKCLRDATLTVRLTTLGLHFRPA